MFHAGNNVSDMYIIINFNNADRNVEQVSLILMCPVFVLYLFFFLRLIFTIGMPYMFMLYSFYDI